MILDSFRGVIRILRQINGEVEEFSVIIVCFRLSTYKT